MTTRYTRQKWNIDQSKEALVRVQAAEKKRHGDRPLFKITAWTRRSVRHHTGDRTFTNPLTMFSIVLAAGSFGNKIRDRQV